MTASAPPNADAYVISYPKSGRTWLRVLVGKALCLQYGLDRRYLLDTLDLTGAAGVLRTELHHDHSELRDDLDYEALPEDKHAYRGRKVIFLARDPRDVLVSSYFEATRRAFLFDGKPIAFRGSVADFVRSPVLGARKVAAFYDIWARNRAVPSDFLLVRYERLRTAPADVLRQVLRFIGAEADHEHVAEAVAYGGFGHMRGLERANAFEDPRLQPGDLRDPQSYKVRRGLVGGYVDYLSRKDIAYIDRELALRGFPFARGAQRQHSQRRERQQIHPVRG